MDDIVDGEKVRYKRVGRQDTSILRHRPGGYKWKAPDF
jgi:hypothetical protein